MTTQETAKKEYPNHPDRQNAFMHGYSVAIKQLQEENEILRNDLDDALDVKNGNGPTALSRVISENQRLKEALKKTLTHWGKMDNPEFCEDDYDNARKLIEP